MKTNLFTTRSLIWLVIFAAVFCTGYESQGFSQATNVPAGDNPTAGTTEADITTDELPASAETASNDIVVTVNGIGITKSQIEERVKPQLDRLATQFSKLPDEFVEQYKKQLQQQALDAIIAELLLNEQVMANNIVVTEQQVMEHIRAIASQQQPPLSLDDFKALVEGLGQSFDEIKARVQTALSYQKLMESKFVGKVNVTLQDANNYYSENIEHFRTPEMVRASHILIAPDTTDPNADPNEAKATAKVKAQDLLKQIQEGADFATLARANSDCPSAAEGGDLGFGRKGNLLTGQRGTWVKPFEDAVFELKVGQVSDVVETQFGYHIIKLADRKPPTVTTFEQAKDGIIAILTERKQNELAEEYIESLKAQANIVYPSDGQSEGTEGKQVTTDSNAVTDSLDKTVDE